MTGYLVTGGMGCIGAWTLAHLVRQGKRAVCFDISEDRHRWAALMDADEQSAIIQARGDITDYAQVKAAFDQHAITHVIHLGALQVPMCRANPVLGSQVNVTGTVNIFEAARQSGVTHVAYASSVAVYGPASDYEPGPLPHDAPKAPRTLYGVYKVCNEQTAQIYFADQGLTSTALRPYTVFGVGRDQGLTSEPTLAMRAAALGLDYAVSFGGRMQFHYASDVARQFILAAEQALGGAYAFNLGTPAVAVQEVADLIMRLKPGIRISVDEKALPFPESFDAAGLAQNFAAVYETPLEEAVAATIQRFEILARSL